MYPVHYNTIKINQEERLREAAQLRLAPSASHRRWRQSWATLVRLGRRATVVQPTGPTLNPATSGGTAIEPSAPRTAPPRPAPEHIGPGPTRGRTAGRQAQDQPAAGPQPTAPVEGAGHDDRVAAR